MIDYLTPPQIKAFLPTNEVATATTWDTVLATLCKNVSRAFDTLTWRPPGAYAVASDLSKYFDGIPATATDYADELSIGELAQIPTAVSVNGVTVSSNDYWPFPYNNLQEGKPFTKLKLNPSGATKSWVAKTRGIIVTGRFGYSIDVPGDVQQALLLYAARMVRKVQQNFMEVGTLLDSGQVMITAKRDDDLAILITYYHRSRL